MQAVSDLVDARFDWAHAFHELGRVLPRDASISSRADGWNVGRPSVHGRRARVDTRCVPRRHPLRAPVWCTGHRRPTATSATPPGSAPVFTLGGCATSQSEVALTLQRLRLIDGVSEVTLQSSTKSGASGGAAGSSRRVRRQPAGVHDPGHL